MLKTFAAVNDTVLSIVGFLLAGIGWLLAVAGGGFVYAAAWLTDTPIEEE